MTNKEKYIKLCADENYAAIIPLFAQPFWLDAVAENWDVCLISDASTKLSMNSTKIKDSNIIAVLPFCWKGKFLTKRIYLPDFSFYQSVILFNETGNKNKIIVDLFQQLPKTIKSYFKFLPEYFGINLSKLNYQKEDYLTYIISRNLQELDLSTNHKRNIQKGIKQKYIVAESKDIQQSFTLLTSTFARQKIKSKNTFSDFEKINHVVKKHHCGKIIDCFDANKNLLASAFIVEDAQTVYYLSGGYNTDYKNSGAMTFLLNHIINSAIKKNKDFNFCGSSKKSIAVFFEGFGAKKTPIAIWKKSII